VPISGSAGFCFDLVAVFFRARGRFLVTRLRVDDVAFCSLADTFFDSSRSLRSFFSLK